VVGVVGQDHHLQIVLVRLEVLAGEHTKPRIIAAFLNVVLRRAPPIVLAADGALVVAAVGDKDAVLPCRGGKQLVLIGRLEGIKRTE